MFTKRPLPERFARRLRFAQANKIPIEHIQFAEADAALLFKSTEWGKGNIPSKIIARLQGDEYVEI